MKKFLSSLLVLSLVLGLFSSSALAADISTSGSSGDVPVELTQAASTFSVTVPTVLPVDVDSDGIVTVATNNSIVNNSYGPVEVKGAEILPQNSWVLKAFTTDFGKSKVGLKEFGFQLNGENVSTDGSVGISNFSVIPGGGSENFTYDANIAVQKSALSNEEIAQVVFTLGWSSAPIIGYEIKTLEDVMDEEGNVSMKVGESVQLSAVALYSLDTPTWESNNTSVVEVTSDGLATAVGVGTATITYTLGEANGTLIFNISKNSQSAPPTPTMASRTSSSITLNAVEGCEYSKDGSTWQDSPIFSGLTAETMYTFYVRYKETANSYASESSSATLKTEEESVSDGPYLTFSSPSSFTLKTYKGAKNWDGTLEYSTDTTSWTTWDGTTTLASSGNVLYLRGTDNTKITGDISGDYRWVLTGSDIACSGNIENLLDYEDVQAGNHPTMADYCYNYMFYYCDSLTTAPALPATTLANSCYSGMFCRCTSLTTAPALPATTLAGWCYSDMFRDCTSLTTAPALPATTLTSRCYISMFHDCTSLTTVPALPATTLADNCYSCMFNGCTSLTAVPELPATTLADYCYYAMFQGCSSIKLSTTKTGEYTLAYRVPTSGTGTTATDALKYMFSSTGGAFSGKPTLNKTYYLSNTNSIVK